MKTYSDLAEILASTQVRRYEKNPVIITDLKVLNQKIADSKGIFDLDNADNPAESGAFYRANLSVEVLAAYAVLRRDLEIFCGGVVIPNLEAE